MAPCTTAPVPETAIPLPECAVPMARRKAADLVGHYGYTHQDREDLAQDLLVAVCEALPNYDAEKAAASHFIHGVLRDAAIDLIRKRTAQCRDYAREDLQANETMTLRDRTGEHDAFAAMDWSDWLDALPRELGRAARLLLDKSPTEAARVMGITRHRMSRLRAELQCRLTAARRGG